MTSIAPASFGPALLAARDAAGSQHYPQATLYVVATPIGNLADITLRALHVLQLVDAIACEDTRHTQSLLRAYGIDRPGAQLLALHQHNESEAAQAVVARLAGGERIAYVSDAGTPGVSDPGARLVAAARDAGHRVLPLPGASCVTTLVGAAGLVSDGSGDSASSAFVFAGFLPSKAGERDSAVQALAGLGGQEAGEDEGAPGIAVRDQPRGRHERRHAAGARQRQHAVAAHPGRSRPACRRR